MRLSTFACLLSSKSFTSRNQVENLSKLEDKEAPLHKAWEIYQESLTLGLWENHKLEIGEILMNSYRIFLGDSQKAVTTDEVLKFCTEKWTKTGRKRVQKAKPAATAAGPAGTAALETSPKTTQTPMQISPSQSSQGGAQSSHNIMSIAAMNSTGSLEPKKRGKKESAESRKKAKPPAKSPIISPVNPPQNSIPWATSVPFGIPSFPFPTGNSGNRMDPIHLTSPQKNGPPLFPMMGFPHLPPPNPSFRGVPPFGFRSPNGSPMSPMMMQMPSMEVLQDLEKKANQDKK
eukprot:TRINITY_DN5154_c0_g2_i2.p1 TRINITY_DN5154_c0_g2~~TRINITY_DN5154_c0_g2_i2.p1  ORF type:complete len:289 (-),score=111.90 TRINITY_DN5154_c0_g2_i2:108-974(-)